MPKLKAPLMGIRAQGTLANSLTYAGRGNLHVVKTVPTHPDVNSTLQRLHRFIYSVGLALWQALTPAEQAVWRTAAVGRNYSGMNAFLRNWLRDPPALELAFPVEMGQGFVAIDKGPNAYDGTIVGATWARRGAFWYLVFDGVDDRVFMAPAPNLDFTTTDYSAIIRYFPLPDDHPLEILGKGQWNNRGWDMGVRQSIGRFEARTFQAPGFQFTAIVTGIPLTTWTTFGFSRSGANITLYRDGVDLLAPTGTHIDPVASPLQAFLVIPEIPGVFKPACSVAWALVFSRALTDAEHLAIHQRLEPQTPP